MTMGFISKKIIKLTIIAIAFSLGIQSSYAGERIRSDFQRYGSSAFILQDILNDDFGPTNDKFFLEGNLKVDDIILKNDKSFHNVSNLKLDKKIKIKTNTIIFSGNTVISSYVLNKYTKCLIGKEVTVEELRKLANKVTDLYQKKGYITSRAIFRPENIKNDRIEIQIIEGKFGNINIVNNKRTKSSYFKNNILKTNKVKEGKVFNINYLNDSYAEINRKKYLEGKIILQENKLDSEKTDLNIKIKEKLPINLETGWDNMGRYNTGISRVKFGVSSENLTGYGDKIYANQVLAHDTYGINTGYNIPFGSYGTEARFGYSFVNTDQNNFWTDYFATESKTHLFRASIVQPLYKNNNLNVISDLSFDIINSNDSYKLKSANLNIDNAYDLRVLRTGITAFEKDKLGKLLARFEVSNGFSFLGASRKTYSNSPSSNFIKLSANLKRTIKLPAQIKGIVKFKGQYSPNSLYRFEELQIGGMNTVRGYDQGCLFGENGYSGSFELERTLPMLPNTVNISYWNDKSIKVPLKDNIKMATFYDYGYIYNRIGGLPNETIFLQNIGFGLRVKLYKNLRANLDLGIPLGDKKYDSQNGIKFFFGITTDIL